MATFNKLPSGYWRAQVRRKGHHISLGKGNERDRRPTQHELDRIIAYNKNNPRQTIPLGRLVKFAIATALRQDEICCLFWKDVDLSTRLAIVCNRKDPRRKSGNDQRVPLLDATGYDAVALLKEQRALALGGDRVFPYNGKSLGTAFRRVPRVGHREPPFSRLAPRGDEPLCHSTVGTVVRLNSGSPR